MAAEHHTERARLRAMGSQAELVVVDGPGGALDAARARLAELEDRWSRFRPSSEVGELNRRAGDAVGVSADTVLLVTLAIEGWRISGGAVDPTVLGAVRRAGYDRSFDRLPRVRPGRPDERCPGVLAACTDIEVGDDAVRLPAGSGFDPGGIGKGLAADLIAADLLAAGAAGACVNVGGDLRVVGIGPTGGGWAIDVDHPDEPRSIARIALGDGGVATSTTRRRRWIVGGVEQHHLIDVATGRPSTTDLVQATAITGRAWVAEVLAKAVLLRGSARAFDMVPSEAGAIALTASGVAMASPGTGRFADVAAIGATATGVAAPADATLAATAGSGGGGR